MLARVDVQKKVDERPLQTRAHAPINGEPRAGDLGGALQIQDLELRAQIPMRFGREIELAGLAPAANFDVVVSAFADGHGLVRDVGDAGHQIAEGIVDGLGFLIERRNRARPWRGSSAGCC